MKRIFWIVLMLFTTLFAFGKEYSYRNVPMVHLQDRNLYVSDPEHILADSTVAIVNALMRDLEDSLSVQTAVIVVPSFGGEDCLEQAYEILIRYGVGQKGLDNGLVVALATEDRCLAFSTGYGMEGVMTDAICKRIQNRHMNPYFANGEWNKGMVEGMRAVHDYLIERADGSIIGDSEPSYTDNSKAAGWFEFLKAIFMLFMVGPITWVIYIILASPYILYKNRQDKECPSCGNHSTKMLSKAESSAIIEQDPIIQCQLQEYEETGNSLKAKKLRDGLVACKCKDCGKEYIIRKVLHYVTFSAWVSGYLRLLLESLARSGGGSRGRGGGYGGGRSGGGGSRSRF